MKKAIVFNALCAALFLLPRSSTAAPVNSNFWFGGLGYDYVSADGANLNGGSVHFGYRGRFAGFESGAGYASLSGVGFTSGYVELQSYLPIGTRLSVVAGAGGAYASASASAFGYTISRTNFGWRAGGGIEYRFTNAWALRAMAHYQTPLANATDYTIGLSYRW